MVVFIVKYGVKSDKRDPFPRNVFSHCLIHVTQTHLLTPTIEYGSTWWEVLVPAKTR